MLGYLKLAIKKDRLLFASLFSMLIICVLCIISLKLFSIERDQTAIVLTAGYLNILFIVTSIFFTTFFIKRLLEGKELEFFISLTNSRNKAILQLNFALIYQLFLIICFYILFFLAVFYKTISLIGLLAYFLSLFLQGMLCISFAIFAGLIIGNINFSLITSLVFYFVSCVIGIVANFEGYAWWILWIFPRMDLLTDTEWLIYGINNVSFLPHLQAVFYFLLILASTAIDFAKKEF